MTGLEKDIYHLESQIEKVNNGELSINSIYGLVSRIKNIIKSLDNHVISNAYTIRKFNEIMANIKDKTTIEIENDLNTIETNFKLHENGTPTENWNSDRYCSELHKISDRIKKLNDNIPSKKILENNFNNISSRIWGVSFAKMIVEESGFVEEIVAAMRKN